MSKAKSRNGRGEQIDGMGSMGDMPLSEQVRAAVRESEGPRYLLASRTQVSESALSRFMAGSHGTSIATVDKLARALGLGVTAPIRRPSRPGPEARQPGDGGGPTKGGAVRMAKWFMRAYLLAKDAHTNHFETRRGVWHVVDLDLLCLYNNNPYEDFPTLRDEELAEFRLRMAEEGIAELAYATYPPEGDEAAGYTYALLLKAGDDRSQWAADTMTAIVKKSGELIHRQSRCGGLAVFSGVDEDVVDEGPAAAVDTDPRGRGPA